MHATVLVLAALMVTAALSPAGASAPGNGSVVLASGPWTAVASSGVIDESALSIFAMTQSRLHYKGGTSGTNPITARYNVTSPVAHPPWTTLELGYFDNSPGSVVTAELWRVDQCTGDVSSLCKATSADSPVARCVTCQLPEALDFGVYLYFVEVIVKRGASTQQPKAHTLRLYCGPTTCADEGANCETIADGCGGSLECGTCTLPATCGGGGTPNVCGCTPNCSGAINACGDDGCGGSCGTCGECFECISGLCQHVTDGAFCSTGQCCGGFCTDTTTDPNHCGSCENVCTSVETCCNSQCADTSSDPTNCGSCGTVCSAGESCCLFQCINTSSDPNHCGSCDTICFPEDDCIDGSCVTNSTLRD